MHYRQLGKSGIQVSEISMGCNRLGEASMSDQHWISLVRRAVELGVNLFDTSESYNWGRSEDILGAAVGSTCDVLIADKVSRVRKTGERDFSAQRVLLRAEESLRRLRRDTIDLYQLHSPSLDDIQQYDWPEAMARLKQAGKIRLAGVSINDAPSGRWLIEQGLVDVLQVAYNMLEFSTGQTIFPLAEQHGVGILVRMPMAQGILTGKFHPGQEVASHHRANMAGYRMASLIERAEAFTVLAHGQDITLSQIALRYAITPTAVSAAIPGARDCEQLEQNVAASNGTGLSPEILSLISEIQSASG